jgi:hypothetical protein
MSFSHLPALLTSTFHPLACWLQRRSAVRLPLLLCGLLCAHGRRTVTSWFRAAGIAADYRPASATVGAVGRRLDALAVSTLHPLKPLLGGGRLTVAIDGTPTGRYGPCVEGAGIPHHPSPGPAGAKYVYGHVWVTLAALAKHPDGGTIALPLPGQRYLRRIDLDKLPTDRRRSFRTKLEMAAAQLGWLKTWAGRDFEGFWAAVEGAYAERPFLRPARAQGVTVVRRLRKDAALGSVPERPPPEERGPGRPPTYGKPRISLAKRAGHQGGWQEGECVPYGAKVVKSIKTFLATWRPAGGMIRVVLVKEKDDGLPFCGSEPEATPRQILEARADRHGREGTFQDVKEVWGAGQQPVRNVHSNAACLNRNLWRHRLVEAWAWGRPEAELVERSAGPWDREPRRPAHADKRKALLREVLQGEIEEALAGRPSKAKIRVLVQRLLDRAA